ncbi:hypothetical protein GCM10023324_15770 [Streptomyces youssoufiensis]
MPGPRRPRAGGAIPRLPPVRRRALPARVRAPPPRLITPVHRSRGCWSRCHRRFRCSWPCRAARRGPLPLFPLLPLLPLSGRSRARAGARGGGRSPGPLRRRHLEPGAELADHGLVPEGFEPLLEVVQVLRAAV